MYLYHGTQQAIAEGVLKPSQSTQIKNGMSGQFVYATHRLDMAMVYATPWLRTGSFLGTVDGSPEDRLAVFIGDGLQAEKTKCEGVVYGFPATDFERVRLGNGTLLREWVSEESVNLNTGKTIHLPVHSFGDLMDMGVQVFFTTPDTTNRLLTLEQNIGGEAPLTLSHAVAKILSEGPESGLIWANQRDGHMCDPRIMACLQSLTHTNDASRHFRPS